MADFETIVLRPRIPKAQSSWNDKASLNPPPHTSHTNFFNCTRHRSQWQPILQIDAPFKRFTVTMVQIFF